MGYLPDPKTTSIFVTASTISLKGRKRKIIVETRPEFAIVHLHGSKERYPLAWETIFEAAVRCDKANRNLEKRTNRRAPAAGAPIGPESDIAGAGFPPKKSASPERIQKLRIA